jgi:hypothetical protein
MCENLLGKVLDRIAEISGDPRFGAVFKELDA